MIVNSDVDIYSKTQNHRKNTRKVAKSEPFCHSGNGIPSQRSGKQLCTAGASKPRLTDHIRPTKPFHPAREAILSAMKKYHIYGKFVGLVSRM